MLFNYATGTVVNGQVVWQGVAPPDGTEVRVLLPGEPPPAPDGTEAPGPHAWMLKYAGALDDLPADFAAQHDHYIHGTPKR